MNVKGIVLENDKGQEFLVSARGDRHNRNVTLTVRKRERNQWVDAKMPMRQRLAMLIVAVSGAVEITMPHGTASEQSTHVWGTQPLLREGIERVMLPQSH